MAGTENLLPLLLSVFITLVVVVAVVVALVRSGRVPDWPPFRRPRD